jgi:hypothetical protein
VAESERGHGLASRLFATVRTHLPGCEAVTFIRRDNAASLQAHLRMGMKEVAEFVHGNGGYAVLTFKGWTHWCRLTIDCDFGLAEAGAIAGPKQRFAMKLPAVRSSPW